MIDRLLMLICGSVRITVSIENSKEILNYLVFEKLKFVPKNTGDSETVSFILMLPQLKKFKEFCNKKEIDFTVSKTMGIPRLFEKYGKRYGVFIGVALFALIVWQSTLYVWSIDVSGNETVESRDILSNLENLGFTYGTNYKRTDFKTLHNEYLKLHDDLCWISVNMKGTHAHVEVRELKEEKAEAPEGIRNIIASESGTIVIVEAAEGKPMVYVGDKVAKGDLVISGVISFNEETVRYECSGGIVLAEVLRNFTVNVPKFREEKVLTGEFYEKNQLIFYKNPIKLYGNYGISHNKYDIIEETVQLKLFGSVELPIFLEKETFREYTVQREQLTKDELQMEEKKLLSKSLEEALDGAELLELTTAKTENDDFIILNCTVKCIADIAEPIVIGELPIN